MVGGIFSQAIFQSPQKPRTDLLFVGCLQSPHLDALRLDIRAPPVVSFTVCMNNDGQPWVSLVVHKTRLQIAQDPSLNYEYLPMMGMKSFIQASLELLFGKHSQAIVENRVRPREGTSVSAQP